MPNNSKCKEFDNSLIDFSRPYIVNNCDLHAMEESLVRYLQIKMHPYIDERDFSEIVVIGKYDRTSGISTKEKSDKYANWQRPTAHITGNKLEIRCFPGVDYVYHYGSAIASYLSLMNRISTTVSIERPSSNTCWRAVELSGISKIKKGDFTILGTGLETMIGVQGWKNHGMFLENRRKHMSAELCFIIIKHSFWGDISDRILTLLKNAGHKRFIFIGKVGGLHEMHLPNQTIVTGNNSRIQDKIITWNSRFNNQGSSTIKTGKHITLPSVLLETKEWVNSNKISYDFVDPEIGHFARAADREGVEFNYLHFVSDNLTKKFKEDLSNERQYLIPQKRKQLFKEMYKIILDNLN